nr:hypothetical protein [Muribaculum intestinale]
MECQEIPPFPAGNRFIETIEHGSERVHPGICPLNAISERQEFSVQQIFLIVFCMIVEIYISNDSGTVTFSSEIVTVKSGIGIEEKAVNGNSCVIHHAKYALDDLAKVSLAWVASFDGCQIRQDFHSYGVFIYEFYQFKECLGVFFLITLNTPYCILYV